MGSIVAYFASDMVASKSMFHKLAVFTAITLLICVVYYSVMPKSDYMLNHLKTEEQIQEWFDVYLTMK